MRVGVVDIGTNSTRLLIADVDGRELHEVERATQVTRLGEGVESTGRLGDDAIERVLVVLAGYAEAIAAAGCDATTAVLTSAVRDAANGAQFTDDVRRRFGLDARTLSGEEEARLTFLGAAGSRTAPGGAPLAVIDIGGGSTELVVGRNGGVEAQASAQLGVVRHTERHMRHDPPTPGEVAALRHDARSALLAALPAVQFEATRQAIAVAGTPTSCAAIDQQLDPYDPVRVHGYVLELESCEALLARLAAMPLDERREVTGLHPDRAPTIVAGVAILVEAIGAFALDRVEVSERDILHGAALARPAP